MADPYDLLFSVKVKQQANGQSLGTGYLGTYGASFNQQATQYAYGKYNIWSEYRGVVGGGFLN